ncbi:MAG: hypothetical protein MI723_17130 [Caulobacterales bacterium]|nr:hypothetical protein [Caulobacterales bacterium]
MAAGPSLPHPLFAAGPATALMSMILTSLVIEIDIMQTAIEAGAARICDGGVSER